MHFRHKCETKLASCSGWYCFLNIIMVCFLYYAGIFQTSADKLDVDGGRGEGSHNAKQAIYRKCKTFKISQNTLRQT